MGQLTRIRIVLLRLRIFSVRILSLVVIGGLAAMPSARAADPSSLIAAHGFAVADIGYLLVELPSGRPMTAWQADRPFVPGSVLKLATSLMAWQTLGPDFRFTTRLWRKGDALYLQGSGDPVLDAVDLKGLAQQLRAARPQASWQHFYIDTAAIIPATQISDRQPVAADYNPGFGALNVDFNRLAVNRVAGQTMSSWQVRSLADNLTVPIDWVGMALSPVPLPAGTTFVPAEIGKVPPADNWWLHPTSPPASAAAKDIFFLPVKQADLMTARIFRAIAGGMGTALPEPQAGAVPRDAEPIATHDSPMLPELLQGLLRYSNNLSAELVGLAAAGKTAGHSLDLAAAAGQQAKWLAAKLPETDWSTFRMRNFSGLDGDNRNTARQMATIVQAIARDPSLAATLPDLVLPDETGAMKLAAGWHITGKSGTMDYAAGLAGLITRPDGRQYAYAIFLADDRRRGELAASFDARILHPAEDGRAWTLRARQLETDLLLDWLAQISK
jgi:D-alanyl-D-alanine carboxypeptidase/D-alanyl-D-alanine-endopeptidase (penicillin-binding protein 4)